MNAADLRVAANLHELSVMAAAAMTEVIAAAINETGKCSLALSGGHTPREVYRLLGSRFRDQIAWDRVQLFWGDERYVPAHDPESNYRMARETLLDHVPCPESNIHPMPTQLPSPEAAAQDYERTLRNYFGADGPRFDLTLLGLGSDGHTASLFAGSPALKERERWVMSVRAETTPVSRLTLTLAALTQSADIFVLVSGANKAAALKTALSPTADADACPAAGLRLSRGEVIWWADRDAVRDLT
jgi:6-phosphogluconolactonase